MRYKLDQRFIDKSVQIRKDFLKSFKIALNRQEIVNDYLKELTELRDKLTDVKDADDFIKKILEIEVFKERIYNVGTITNDRGVIWETLKRANT